MERRDFMKALAVAPAGMVEEKEEAVHFILTVGKHGLGAIADNGDNYLKAHRAFWKPLIGRKVKTTFHKDGLDVRFV